MSAFGYADTFQLHVAVCDCKIIVGETGDPSIGGRCFFAGNRYRVAIDRGIFDSPPIILSVSVTELAVVDLITFDGCEQVLRPSR